MLKKISEVLKKYESLNNDLYSISLIVHDFLVNSLITLTSKNLNDVPNVKGLYLFCFNGGINEMENKWSEHLNNCPFASPFNKTKFKNCVPIIDDLYPMYVGKSENLNERVNQHWNLNNDSSTRAMRLEKFIQHNSFKAEQIRFSYIDMCKFGMDESTYYLCSAIERNLKNNLFPFIGR